MRAQTQFLIALSILACFAAAASISCSLFNNDKTMCQAANSLCTWTDAPANNQCVDACPSYSQSKTDCIANKSCAFTDNTCAFKTTCTTAAQADCTNANNCSYNPDTCIFKPGANMKCWGEGYKCLDPLPSYCTKQTFTDCEPDPLHSSTCPQGVATQADCTDPCSVATGVTIDTCMSVCDNLNEVDCGNYPRYCDWNADSNTCTELFWFACSTIGLDACIQNRQCIVGKSFVYDCSLTTYSLYKYCAPTNDRIACTIDQNGWCRTTNTDDCEVNQNYCVLGAQGNACGTDNTFCSTTSCTTLDDKACTFSFYSPTCNTTYCTGAFPSCSSGSATGCKYDGTTCTPNDDSCFLIEGGTCTNNSSDTPGTCGYITTFNIFIFTFILAF